MYLKKTGQRIRLKPRPVPRAVAPPKAPVFDRLLQDQLDFLKSLDDVITEIVDKVNTGQVKGKPVEHMNLFTKVHDLRVPGAFYQAQYNRMIDLYTHGKEQVSNPVLYDKLLKRMIDLIQQAKIVNPLNISLAIKRGK